jgi:hypothetical protein
MAHRPGNLNARYPHGRCVSLHASFPYSIDMRRICRQCGESGLQRDGIT